MAKGDMEALRKENEELRRIVAKQEVEREAAHSQYSPSIQSEIRKIRQTQGNQNNAAPIVVRERHDHKNISLWTRDGQRIGPMHPDNAERLLHDRAAMGQILLASQPTAEMVEAYRQTAEYKAQVEWEEKRRAKKNKSRKAGQLEKLATEISKMTGMTVEAMNKIVRASEVKPLSEVR